MTSPPPPASPPPASPAAWARDLALGARFALAGGRSGWLSTGLTALALGLSVVVLLLAASVPSVIAGMDGRVEARGPACHHDPAACRQEPGPGTVLYQSAGTHYRGQAIDGARLQPDAGPQTTAAPPPGLAAFPGPGQIVVSPALGRLLDSPEGALLAERFDAERVGTIADEGLEGPAELYFYLGTDSLDSAEAVGGAIRTSGFATEAPEEPMNAPLIMLTLVICVVLLTPVAVFVTTAVRFGGERRDRRLAAVRLLGADATTTRRIAAGETLAGTLLGVAWGTAALPPLRAYLGTLAVAGRSTFPTDITPSAPLAALVLLGVPVTAVAVTLVALRGVAIEPLGVVRHATAGRRRLAWRVIPGAIGLLLLLGLLVQDREAVAGIAGQAQTVLATVLLLIAATVLLPWLVERVVGALVGGPVSWQLATRRLQLSGGAAARAVSGLTVAVAGATALYMVFGAVRAQETVDSVPAVTPFDATVSGWHPSGDQASALPEELRAQPGVTGAIDYVAAYLSEAGGEERQVVVGDCRALRHIVATGPCAPGDVFVPRTAPREVAAGDRPLPLGDGGQRSWAVPDSARRVPPRDNDLGASYATAVLATPQALDPALLQPAEGVFVEGVVELALDPGDEDAVERLINVTWEYTPQPALVLAGDGGTTPTDEFATVQRGLLVGAAAVTALMGASLLVTLAEQLRERRRQLAALVAFGTPRATLSLSVLWQNALPIALGLALAAALGTGMGALLTAVVELPVGDWFAFVPMMGVGAAVIAATTLFSMPLLWRLMRPDGLRAE